MQLFDLYVDVYQSKKNGITFTEGEEETNPSSTIVGDNESNKFMIRKKQN
jgi:hypothetical protein